MFPFDEETQISELLKYLKREVEEEFVYFKSKNLNIDYLLTLGHRRVKELSAQKLELWVHKIRIVHTNLLLNF